MITFNCAKSIHRYSKFSRGFNYPTWKRQQIAVIVESVSIHCMEIEYSSALLIPGLLLMPVTDAVFHSLKLQEVKFDFIAKRYVLL